MYPNSASRTSALLSSILQEHEGDRIYVQDVLNQLGNRAFGPALLLCSLPEALPLPPMGVSALVGLPLMLISAQLLAGFSKPWLPRWFRRRSIKRSTAELVIQKSLKFLSRIERYLHPRWPLFTTPLAERLIALLILILGLVISLPIPLGNFLPALAIMIISLGLIEKDGVAIACGIVSAIVILALMTGAIIVLIRVALPRFL